MSKDKGKYKKTEFPHMFRAHDSKHDHRTDKVFTLPLADIPNWLLPTQQEQQLPCGRLIVGASNRDTKDVE